MPIFRGTILASCLAGTLFVVAILAIPSATAKGPSQQITVCGELRCVVIQERPSRWTPLTGALLTGGHSGTRPTCRDETHRVRIKWRGTSSSRSLLIVAKRGLRGERARNPLGPGRWWTQVHTWRRAALKRAARRAGPGTPLCRLTSRSRLLTGTLSRPWLYP